MFCKTVKCLLAVIVLESIVLIFTCQSVCAEQPYNEEWSRQIGTSSYDEGRSVTVDGAGNVYISGSTSGSLFANNLGLYDAFLAKYNASGNLLWSKQIGTSNHDFGVSVALDGTGSIYIGGVTTGNLFETNVGNKQGTFLAKYDSGGNFLWGKQHFDTIDPQDCYSVATDMERNVYMSGVIYGNMSGPNAGNYFTFLTKYDSIGNQIWSKQIKSSSMFDSASVAVDGAGNAFLSGRTFQNDLFGPNTGSGSVYLAKYDSLGNLLWGKQPGIMNDSSNSVAVDKAGNAYICGGTSASLNGPNAGLYDAFLSKFDPLGNPLWSRLVGTSNHDYGYSVTIDGEGNAFISGWYDSSTGTGGDAFLAKIDSSGNLLWTKQIGTSSNDLSNSVAVDGDGKVYICGYTDGSLCGANAGSTDAFLIKFTPETIPEPSTFILIVTGALGLLSYAWRQRRFV